jgi:uncharacterized protein (DUF736 family)
MNIGYFTKQESGSLIGDLPTMGFHQVVIEAAGKKSDKSPDYIAHIDGAELGAAWKKTSAKGKPYLSFKVTVPGLPVVWLAIRSTDVSGQYVASYSEKREGKATESADEAAF